MIQFLFILTTTKSFLVSLCTDLITDGLHLLSTSKEQSTKQNHTTCSLMCLAYIVHHLFSGLTLVAHGQCLNC